MFARATQLLALPAVRNPAGAMSQNQLSLRKRFLTPLPFAAGP